MLVDEQWCQQEVVQQKQQEEHPKPVPHHQHFVPVEHRFGLVNAAHSQADEWGCKKQSPHRQI